MWAVNPSVKSVRLQARTGRTAVSGRVLGMDGILASVQMTARDGRAVTAGVSSCAICLPTPHVIVSPIGDSWPNGIYPAATVIK